MALLYITDIVTKNVTHSHIDLTTISEHGREEKIILKSWPHSPGWQNCSRGWMVNKNGW